MFFAPPKPSMRSPFVNTAIGLLEWIWLPVKVKFLVSADGKEFRELGVMDTKMDEHEQGTSALYYQFGAKTAARYVRVVGVNRGTCPPWHPGAGHKAWLFADEIEVETE